MYALKGKLSFCEQYELNKTHLLIVKLYIA